MKVLPFLLGTTLVGTSVTLATPAQATQFGFTNITHNNTANAALGETTLGLDVSAVNSDQVAFTFTNSNSNPLSPVITQLYFDGNPTLSDYMRFTSFSSSTGRVSFQTVKNGVLPGGNGSLINFQVDYQANAVNPRPFNGIGGGESLSLLFNLTSGVTFNNILDHMRVGTLRVGTHVQAFSNGGSESFITASSTAPPQPVPEPITILGSVAAIACGTLLQRQRNCKNQNTKIV